MAAGISTAWIADAEDPAHLELPEDATPEDIIGGVYSAYLEPDAREDPGDQADWDHQNSPRWQEWIRLHRAGGIWALLQIETRTDVVFTTDRPNGDPADPEENCLMLQVPVAPFLAKEAQRDTYRHFYRELWLRAAEKFGWPLPPELPPYADPATMPTE